MYHNGGFPPIYEGGQKETIQREFSAKNILSISQILVKHQHKPILNRVVQNNQKFNVIDNEPQHNKKK